MFENNKKMEFSKNPKIVKNLFNSISKNYDKLNNIMSFGLHNIIKNSVTNNLRLNPNAKILDLCTGTGDLAAILRKKYPNAEIIGVDFSCEMLNIARKKHPEINFTEADCTNLPFKDNSFSICIISFGLRNIEQMEKAIQEIHRVLKEDGTFINLDLGKPNRFFNIFLKPYMYMWVSFLGKIFNGDETPYKYLAVSNETFPHPNELKNIYTRIGFSNIKIKNYLFGQISSQICTKKGANK